VIVLVQRSRPTLHTFAEDLEHSKAEGQIRHCAPLHSRARQDVNRVSDRERKVCSAGIRYRL
jgi:hypothetical protein